MTVYQNSGTEKSHMQYEYYNDNNAKKETAYRGTTVLSRRDYEYIIDAANNEFKTKAVIYKNASESAEVIQAVNKYGYKLYDSINSKKQTYTVDKMGNVTAFKDLKAVDENYSGNTETYYYDYANRVYKTAYADGTYIQNTYDTTTGQLISRKDTTTNTTTITYNAMGLPEKESTPQANNLTLNKYTYYDVNGNAERVEEQSLYYSTETLLTRSTYSYDNRNRVRVSLKGDTEGVGYEYDGAGKITAMATGLTSLTDTINPLIHHVTAYTYDTAQNLSTITDALGSTETYYYNNLGELETKIDRNGSWIDYAYDGLGRLTGISAYSGYDAQTEYIDYLYDYLGNVTQMADSTGTTYYTYDTEGLLTGETKGSVIKNYTYDAAGNKLSFRLRDGSIDKTVTNTYDYNGRLKTVTDGNDVTTYTYNNKGLLYTRETKTGTTVKTSTTYSYNQAGLPQAKTNKRGTTNAERYTITYYANGNMKTSTLDYDVTTTYTYDLADRLVSEQVGNSTTTYTYDIYGNRTGKVKGNTTNTYTYDACNRLLTNTETKPSTTKTHYYTYDSNGNMTTDVFNSTTRTYVYNPLNNLVSMTYGTTQASYAYDGNGLLQSKTDTAGKTTNLIYDGADIVYSKYYTDNPVLFTRGHELISYDDGSGTRKYYHSNQHGDISLITDDTNTTVSSYKYDAYGNYTNSVPGTDKNPFGYCGEYYESSLSCIYLRARFYQPEIGRFMTEDPIRDGLNWYAYCGNNPIMYIDPLGEDAIIITNKNSVGIEGIATAGHTSAIYQDANGEWYYTYWGNKAAAVIHIPNTYIKEYRRRGDIIANSMDSLSNFNNALNRILSEYGLENITKDYTDATYIVGDFTASLEAAYADVNDAATNIFSTRNGLTTLEDGSLIFQGHNSPYNAVYRNCLDKTYASLSKGTLSNGMNVGTYMKALGFQGGMIPNNAIPKFSEMFMNSSFTYSGAYSSLLNYTTLYNQGSPWAQKREKAHYANAVRG